MKQPYKLVDAFEWAALDINNPEQLGQVYTLLMENYVGKPKLQI